jgi:sirohydrochlorin cobaltochelatase
MEAVFFFAFPELHAFLARAWGSLAGDFSFRGEVSNFLLFYKECCRMKKRIWLAMAALMTGVSLGGMVGGSSAYAAESAAEKKAILVVSFGTTYADTRTKTIEAVENKISAAFPDYAVRRAFSSRIVIKKLMERDGVQVDTEIQALDKLKAEGFTEVIIQPLHIEPGDEYEKVQRAAAPYIQSKAFASLKIGRPILYFMGQEERPDDYLTAIQAIQTQLPRQKSEEAVVWMGHGGNNPANAAYAVMQMKMEDAGVSNNYIYTVEAYPSLENVIKKLSRNKIKKVTLMPFMLVAGDHAQNDMAGDEDDSAKSVLAKAGFKVDVYLHGLGENPAIQNIYVQHVKDAIEGKYVARSKDKPIIPVIE